MLKEKLINDFKSYYGNIDISEKEIIKIVNKYMYHYSLENEKGISMKISFSFTLYLLDYFIFNNKTDIAQKIYNSQLEYLNELETLKEQLRIKQLENEKKEKTLHELISEIKKEKIKEKNDDSYDLTI